MKSFHRYVFVAAMALLAGCRQPDGPMPVADAEAQNRLGDVSRDLMSMVSRQPDATKDLADDLKVFAPNAEAEQAADHLATQLGQVVPGSRLTEQSAQRLARNCWTAISGPQLSQRQVEGLQNDVEGLLSSIGVAEQKAHEVAAQLADVQSVVSERKRRWYELF